MKQQTRIASYILLLFSFAIMSCKKYLDEKPLQSTVIPKTLNDLQALLDNISRVNMQTTTDLLEAVSDNYYLNTSDWQSLPLSERLNYIWDKDAEHFDSWRQPYIGPIYYSNVVLDLINTVTFNKSDNNLSNNIKGDALFYRSFAFERLAQLYCRPYSSTANTDLGIVLKLNSNIAEPLKRATVQQTYDQIINDLKAASELLPDSVAYPTRPNKAAAYGTLARVYLSMRDYGNGGRYADLCLQKQNQLMDYNNYVSTNFPRFNKEMIYYDNPLYLGIIDNYIAKIDSSLYQSYTNNDLRKSIFFQDNGDGTFGFQGSYIPEYANFVPFDGINTDEIYLIRAECYARAGNINAAMTDLNTLMITRWKSGAFVPFTAIDKTTALNTILTERRKELLFRNLRWSDIRRLNIEGANITLKRIVNGITYTLPPNGVRSVMLIPQQVVSFSGYPQNPR